MKKDNALSSNAPHRRAIRPLDYYEIGNADEKRKYRFVNRTILERSGGFDPRGWIPLSKENSKGESLISQWGTAATGSELRIGDLVLCFIPIEQAIARREAINFRRNLRIQAMKKLRQDLRSVGADVDFSIQRPGRVDSDLS